MKELKDLESGLFELETLIAWFEGWSQSFSAFMQMKVNNIRIFYQNLSQNQDLKDYYIDSKFWIFIHIFMI